MFGGIALFLTTRFLLFLLPSNSFSENFDTAWKGFQDCNVKLDQILKGLNEYLEQKRSVFPRFYFLSDPDLISILSQTKSVTAVQSHLPKCFQGINLLDFSADNKILALRSREEEKVALTTPVDPEEGLLLPLSCLGHHLFFF